jgi:SAM-dependent methyltransferase
MDEKTWFASWFDTDYYHILYKDRDMDEARRFVGNLCRNLALPPGATILDLACGKGRHSLTFHNLGFEVTGADLSENSILEASKKAKKGLRFVVHDMRDIIPGAFFDAVFNIFTSFGYFDSTEDNIRVIQSVHSMLNRDGLFVIDFMNASKVIRTLEPEAILSKGGLDFHIKKRYDGQFIYKDIRFEDHGKAYHFIERVQAFTEKDFRAMLEVNGFEILRTFGDFDLHPFNVVESDRLIVVAKKR